MAKVLLISNKDLVKFTALNGSIDPDKTIHFISIAQDIYLQQYLGSKLLTKLLTDTASNTLTTDYSDLINIYLKPMLIHFSAVEMYPFIAYSISNKGVYKHSAENSEVVSKNEVDYLVEKERVIAENYAQRFLDYMQFNYTLFPEYLSGINNDINPKFKTDLTSWYLD
jgi:hypothetical protein